MAFERIRRKREVKAATPIDYGTPGDPINHSHPFYFGFLAALGAVLAVTMLRALASASQIFILIIISLFLAMGLNPIVEAFRRRGLSRTLAVTAVFVAVMAFVGVFVWLVIPPVISQGTSLIERAPSLLTELNHNKVIADLNSHYGVIDQLQAKLKSFSSNGTLLITAFGGVVGVGKSVISGTFAGLTILILTLYFLASLPQVIELGIRTVPATRRPRVRKLTEGIIARIGAYIGSQITVAFIAGVFIFFYSIILGIPSPIALAMLVFVCGLVPLVGHFLGSILFTIVALTQSVTTGIAAFIGYVLYVQIENYIITPRIMRRSLSMPGLVTIIAAMLGASLLGLVGALLAVPLAAAAILILDEVVFPRADNS